MFGFLRGREISFISHPILMKFYKITLNRAYYDSVCFFHVEYIENLSSEVCWVDASVGRKDLHLVPNYNICLALCDYACGQLSS